MALIVIRPYVGTDGGQHEMQSQMRVSEKENSK